MKKKVAIGIDIGGTNTVFGLVTRDGECLFYDSIPTQSDSPPEILFGNIFSKLADNEQKGLYDHELIGVGIGAPNANNFRCTIENPPNLSWDFVDVKEIVGRFSDLPVFLTNDANAAAVGEMMYGAARGMKNFIEITLGTGLGSGIIVEGNLVYGHDGFAGEIGHTIYDPAGRLCGCGRKGCLETYASATGIVRTVHELLSTTDEESILREVPEENISAKMIHEAALEGDPVALKAFDFTARVLGLKLADAVAHTSPEAIILFGGLAQSGDLLLVPTKKYMEESLFHVFKNKVALLPSGIHQHNAAILGAAALAWHQHGAMVHTV